ncbi:MAG: DUF3048 domain-containing protein [Bacteroidota bacterium]|nr:DUF3048 domain-containing protein [Bacteroidota bacterium]
MNEIGPVRSARPYYLDYAMEYDSIYVHYERPSRISGTGKPEAG